MAYFLKKCTKKGRVYLSIVNSFYDSKRGYSAHETYKSFGTGTELIEQGITDPIAYCEELVKKLNFENRQKEVSKISDKAPVKFAGHFLINAIINKLKVKEIVDIYSMTTNFKFDLYDLLCSLIFSRIIKPCSKYKTFNDVIPYLNDKYSSFSYDQLLSGLEYFGENYERFVEIFTKMFKEKYKFNTDHLYFDCTNFYFEIDKEDEYRRKGPSKENRPLPLIGMGLLLDGNQIPIGLKLFPGNQSEKPVIRDIINDLKNRNEVSNKIVQVADKGLNCARNVYEALKNGDGYIFSKSCKQLPDAEKKWVLSEIDFKEIKDTEGNVIYKIKNCIDKYTYKFTDDNDNDVIFTVNENRVVTYNPSLARKQLHEIQKLELKAQELCLSKAKKDEFGECSKYVDFKGTDGSKAIASLNMKKINNDKELCGYNLIVSSELELSNNDIYKIYHNLWRIEESFRIMKSELDARPVFLQKKNTIYGHFLICYLATFLIRILQIFELGDNDSYQEIFNFIRDFKFINSKNKYINIATKSEFIESLILKTNLPLNNSILSKKQLNTILNYKF